MQDDCQVEGQSGLHNEFEGNPVLKKEKKN
jgi:hypothetical protein